MLPSGSLKNLYEDLLTSEARHHALYVDFAFTEFGEDLVRPRLLEIAKHEAYVMQSMPSDFRLHNGGGAL